MKLRSVFSAAALFLSAGVAFALAVEPADETTRRETIYPFRNPTPPENNNTFARYFSDNAGNSTLTITLIPYTSITETEDVQGLYSIGHIINSKPRGSSDEGSALSGDARTSQSDAGSKQAESETTAPVANRAIGEDRLPAYDFSVPFDKSITEEIGFTDIRDIDDENELGFLRSEDKEPDDSQISENRSYSILAFEKRAFHNSPNRAQILFGGDYNKKFKKMDDDEISVPVAFPLSMLTFAIGAAILLTVFTSAEKKEL